MPARSPVAMHGVAKKLVIEQVGHV